MIEIETFIEDLKKEGATVIKKDGLLEINGAPFYTTQNIINMMRNSDDEWLYGKFVITTAKARKNVLKKDTTPDCFK